MNDDPEYISTQRVAKMFGVTTYTVRNWIAQGKITAIQVHGRWRVNYDSVLALAHDQYGGTP